MTGSRPDGHPAVRATRAAVVTVVQVLVGLMWLYNIAWKRPPDFGRESDSGLYHYTAYAVSDPVLPPFSWLVEHLVLPNIAIFGWSVLVVETVLAVALLTSAWVRPAAVVGALQSLAIGLCVAAAPQEWPWSYWLMVAVHLLVLVTADDRVVGVDSMRRGRIASRAVALPWVVVAGVIGLLGVVLGGTDGVRLGTTSLSLSLGTWTRWPASSLLVAAALLAVGVLASSRAAAGAAALLAAVVGVLVVFSGMWSIPWADGDNTAAGVLFALSAMASVCVLGKRRGSAGATS